MKDRIPVNPGRVLITPEDGSTAFYATMTRADNPTQEGDPLNKANLLKDDTAALFGLGDTAVPDEVLAWLGKYNQYWWKKTPVSGGVAEYVHSADRNAYLDSGIVDNYEYQYLGIPFDNSVMALKMEAISYKGTGVYGSSENATVITFEKSPKLFFICSFNPGSGTNPVRSWGASSIFSMDMIPTSYYSKVSNTKFYIKKSEDGKTVSMYTIQDSAVYQYNGLNYDYVAIGLY